MKNLKAAVFDMDGVLFDSERLCLDGWKVVAARHSLENIEEVALGCIGRTTHETRKRLSEAYKGIDIDALHDELRYWIKARIAEQGLPKKPFAAETLSELHAAGLPLALASSTRYVTVCSELKDAGLYDYFDVVIGGDLIAKSKPEPDIYLAACDRLGVAPSEAAAIEDSYNGIRSAKAAGMTTIMVPDILMPTEEISRLTDYCCKDLSEAKALLLSL